MAISHIRIPTTATATVSGTRQPMTNANPLAIFTGNNKKPIKRLASLNGNRIKLRIRPIISVNLGVGPSGLMVKKVQIHYVAL